MAIRTIREHGDEILRKKCKKVDVINDRLITLIEDMKETMYSEDGVGLAAPQVGVLKRVAVIDIGEGPIVLINPEILAQEGSYIDVEGCLSLPEEQGEVERPYKIKVKALNEKGEEIVFEAEELFSRAICHELDHLEGVLFIDKIIDKNIE